MKLYYHPASPNGRRAILTLRQLGLSAEEIVVEFARGENSSAEYTQLNPNQKVPTLVDGDFVLWESNAIMQYLASKKPEAGLMPRDERGRADLLRWQCWNMNHFAPAVGTFNWENLLKRMFGGGDADAAKLAQADKELTRFGKVLDAHLADRRYVLGDQLSVADLSLASTLMYRVPAKVPLEPFSNVRRMIESIEALDSWKSTQPKLG
ncbi:MAG TPA: glutathione S-transferase family protein [Polyangiales bacterium]